MSWEKYILVFIGSYIVGSVPFSYFIPKLKGIDIREHGSGNVGATNVLRVMGLKYGIPAYVLDILKGLVPVLIVSLLFRNPFLEVVGGMGAVMGHTRSVFLGLRGGRGVATSLGVLSGMEFPMCLTAPIAVFLFLIALSRTGYVSVGSLTATAGVLLSSIVMWALGLIHPAYLIFSTLGAALIIFRHRENIKRLLEGKELRIGR